VQIQRYGRLRLIKSYSNQGSESKKNLNCDLGAPWQMKPERLTQSNVVSGAVRSVKLEYIDVDY
jgi:hypothetical protein